MGAHRVNPFARGNMAPPRPSRVRDAFDRELATGDLVLVPQPAVNTFFVAEIAPELAPNAPPNLVRITLMQRMVIHVKADMSTKDLILINPAPEPSANGDGTVAEDLTPKGGDMGLVVTDADVIDDGPDGVR